MILIRHLFQRRVSKQLGHAIEIITVDVYGDNEGIIADYLNELEPFIESVKLKTMIQDNDFSNDSDLLEQEK